MTRRQSPLRQGSRLHVAPASILEIEYRRNKPPILNKTGPTGGTPSTVHGYDPGPMGTAVSNTTCKSSLSTRSPLRNWSISIWISLQPRSPAQVGGYIVAMKESITLGDMITASSRTQRSGQPSCIHKSCSTRHRFSYSMPRLAASSITAITKGLVEVPVAHSTRFRVLRPQPLDVATIVSPQEHILENQLPLFRCHVRPRLFR